MKEHERKLVDDLLKKAKGGCVQTQHNLAVMYSKGMIVKQNEKTALFWWRHAATGGWASAKYGLGKSYYEGNGVEKNAFLAEAWLRLAAPANADAAKLLRKLLKENNASQEGESIATPEVKKRKVSEACIDTLDNRQFRALVKKCLPSVELDDLLYFYIIILQTSKKSSAEFHEILLERIQGLQTIYEKKTSSDEDRRSCLGQIDMDLKILSQEIAFKERCGFIKQWLQEKKSTISAVDGQPVAKKMREKYSQESNTYQISEFLSYLMNRPVLVVVRNDDSNYLPPTNRP